MPEELKEWAQDTFIAVLAGLLFGGGKRWVEERQAGERFAGPITATADPVHMVVQTPDAETTAG